MHLRGRNKPRKMKVFRHSDRGDPGVEFVAHRAVADQQEVGVRIVADDLRRRRDDVFIPFHREEPRKRRDHAGVFRNSELSAQFRLPDRIGESGGIHPAVNDLVLFARSDGGFNALIDHRLRNSENPVAITRRNAFRKFVNRVFPAFFIRVERLTVQVDSISDLGLPYPDCATLLLRHASGAQGVLAADVVSPKAVRNFECFGDGLHLFWEGNPKALYRFENGEKQFVDTYGDFTHDPRYSDNIVENAYVDELANFFAVLQGREAPRWSFEKDRAAIALMDQVQAAGQA